jgi:hypothetical protein
VKVYSPDNQRIRQFGSTGALAGQFTFPTGLAVTPAGEIFVSDQCNERIQVFDATGTYLRKFGGPLGMLRTNTTFGRIQGLLADAQGRLFLADSFRGSVVVVNAATGTILGNLGTFGSDPGQLSGPASLAIDRNNRLFVAAPGNTRVEVYGLDAYSDPHILFASLTVTPTELSREDPADRRTSTLSLRSRGPHARRGAELPEFQRRRLVSVLIKIPGVDPSTIQPGSLTANGIQATRVPGAFLGDFDGNGLLEYRAWFDQDRLVATMPDENAFLVLSGRLSDGRTFESIAEMKVVNLTGGVQ